MEDAHCGTQLRNWVVGIFSSLALFWWLRWRNLFHSFFHVYSCISRLLLLVTMMLTKSSLTFEVIFSDFSLFIVCKYCCNIFARNLKTHSELNYIIYTCVGFSTVWSYVFFKGRRIYKCFTTLSTLVWFFLCDFIVDHLMIWTWNCFSTNVATDGFFLEWALVYFKSWTRNKEYLRVLSSEFKL